MNILNLLAAHCIHDKQVTEIFMPDDILAIFGAHNIGNSYEAGRNMQSPKNIFIHEDWSNSTGNYDADLSLLEFEPESIHFNRFVQPICLWLSADEPPVLEGTVTGWGKSENPTRNHEEEPKMVKAPIQTNEQCFLTVKGLLDLSSFRTFCAGLGNGSGVCLGDSGRGSLHQSRGCLLSSRHRLVFSAEWNCMRRFEKCGLHKRAQVQGLDREYNRNRAVSSTAR